MKVAKLSRGILADELPEANRRTIHEWFDEPMTTTHLAFDTRSAQTQAQTLTPRLQYAVRLLQLSSLDYVQELNDVMAKNPFLEIGEAPASADPQDGDSQREGAAPSELPDGDGSPRTSERDAYLQSSSGVRDGAAPPVHDATEWIVARVGLREHLSGQARVLPLSQRDLTLVCSVIESLDDDGQLRIGLDELAAMVGLTPKVRTSEMNTALKLVQSFDPVGVGARDIAECLLLQWQQLARPDLDLGRLILNDHMERLAQRDVAGIARRLGRDVAAVQAACEAIRRLDPRPGWRFGDTEARFVTPDVVVRKLRGTWTAQLNPAIVPRIGLNHTYVDLFRRHREPRHAEMATHLQEARWTVRNAEQRFSTILQVSQSIVRRQHLFFEHGSFAMKPLALREIAEELGMHESTVCRVTNNKFMATPSGLFELKRFFSRPMAMASGGVCSSTAIRGVIQEMVASEDTSRPLSDVQIGQYLARQGLNVARRTVTKYRQMLRIAPAGQRRRHKTPQAQDADGATPHRRADTLEAVV